MRQHDLEEFPAHRRSRAALLASAVTFASSTTCDSAGVCTTAFADDVSDRLLDQGCIGLHQRQILRQTHVDALARRRAVAPRSPRARTISRRSIQSRRSSSAPASMRVIARRLRTISSRSSASVLIWPSRSFFAGCVELVAQLDQAGGGAQDRRQRRAEIVRHRCEQRIAHALGFGRRFGAHHLACKRGALERRGGLLDQCIQQGARLRIERRRRLSPWQRR